MSLRSRLELLHKKSIESPWMTYISQSHRKFIDFELNQSFNPARMYSGCWLCRRQRLGFNLCKLFCGRFPFMHCAKLIKPYCLNYVDSNTLPNLGQLWEKSPENHNFGFLKKPSDTHICTLYVHIMYIVQWGHLSQVATITIKEPLCCLCAAQKANIFAWNWNWAESAVLGEKPSLWGGIFFTSSCISTLGACSPEPEVVELGKWAEICLRERVKKP